MNDIKQKLDRLADMQAQLDAIRLHYQDLMRSLIPEEIQTQLDEVRAEEETAMSAARAGIERLENEIKLLVLNSKESVRGEYLHAVFNKGRVTWNGKGLEGYAVAHPEVEEFMKVGSPSVSIRSVK